MNGSLDARVESPKKNIDWRGIGLTLLTTVLTGVGCYFVGSARMQENYNTKPIAEIVNITNDGIPDFIYHQDGKTFASISNGSEYVQAQLQIQNGRSIYLANDGYYDDQGIYFPNLKKQTK
jgi:hypothetical protein